MDDSESTFDKLGELTALLNKYENCDLCPTLCEGRTRVVFGAGKISAALMIVGEAPGEEDDVTGIPFSGKDPYLSDALAEAGLRKSSDLGGLYMTNVVLCRPFNLETGKKGVYKQNRVPTQSEQDACRDRLHAEIYAVDPKVILLLGATAAAVATRNKLSDAGGQLYYVNVPGRAGHVLKYPAIVTWSPGFLIRGNQERTKGSPVDEFYNHVRLAVNLVRASQTLSTCPTENRCSQ